MRTFRHLFASPSDLDVAPDPRRRQLLAAAAGVATAAIAPGVHAKSQAGDVATDSSSLHRYARLLGGGDGEDVLWWFAEDLYLHTVGESLVPVGRPMTVGVFRGVRGTALDYRYEYREAGVLLDLATAEPLVRHPITGAAVEPPPLHEAVNMVDWKLLADGTVAKTIHGRVSTAHQRWTVTRENVLLLETHPGTDAFGLASGEPGADWEAVQSTHTFYARRRDLDGDGFVPAQWNYNIATRTVPAWLAPADGRDRRLVVRGLGTKTRARQILNRDTFAWVKARFPDFL